MIILCSATPSLESFYNVKKGKFDSIILSKRVNQLDLPKTKLIDMKNEDDIISKDLYASIQTNIANKNQTLLFVNKRGYAPFVICKKCGFTKNCKSCNTSLVLHNFKTKKNVFLLCHHCGYRESFLNICPSCESKDSFYFPGMGVEKIFEIISNYFPKAKISILSSDTIKNTDKFKKIISKIVSNEIDIIIGTQLISKGHNFPALKTVGIINIDNLMNDFDFRSYEKTFQQVIQVGGRAGRKDLQGEVLLQTLQPNHTVMKLCESGQNTDFLNWELDLRRKSQQPPYVNYISLIFLAKNENKLINASNSISSLIRKKFKSLDVYGPSPAVLYKKSNNYRYKLLLKLKRSVKLQKEVKTFLMKIRPPSNIKLYIDVDPKNFI